MVEKAGGRQIQSWRKWIRPEVKIVFISVLISGIVCHGTALFNKLSLRDEIAYMFIPGQTVSIGRWALYLLSWLEGRFFGNGNTSLPLFNGLLSILLIGATGSLLVELLQIRNRVYCALLGVLMVAFPFVTALFGYMFTSHYYMIGLLMMACCTWIICNQTPWWAKIPAVLLGAFSAGIYQMFLCFLVSILLIYDISFLCQQERRLSDFFRLLGIQAVCMVGVLMLYFAGNQIFLRKFGIELSGYQGIDQMGALPISTYLARCVTAYREFFSPTQGGFQEMYPGTLHTIYQATVPGGIFLAVRQIISVGRSSNAKAILLACLFLLAPLACNFIYVMTDFVHGVMVYGQVMHFVIILWLLDRAEFSPIGLQRSISLLASLVLSVMAVMFARYDNQCYLKRTLQQQQAISYWTTLITRIKSVEGYQPDKKLSFIGIDGADDPTIYGMEELEFIRLVSYDSYTNWFLYNYYDKIMARWCGFEPPLYWGPPMNALPEVQAMPCYPADGSIRMFDDVIVIKLSDA